MLERAASPLAAGRATLLDATFGARRERDEARRLAARLGVPIALVEVRAAREVARRRLTRRQEQGRDPSEAGPGLLAHSERSFRPPAEWPWPARHVVRTDRIGWRREVRALAGALRSSAVGASACGA